ncbi:ankyrin repeat-containing domain protein [Schizophyllum commune]
MQSIIQQPGYLSIAKGGQTLRELYVDNSAYFDSRKLTTFGLYCYMGEVECVRRAVESGNAPDIEGTETPYRFGYITLTVSGGQRLEGARSSGSYKHAATLTYLLSVGAPVDKPDIAGYTALQHVTMNHTARPDLARLLIEVGGADVNARNRYGEVALLLCFQSNIIPSIDLLMEHGADVDIADADGLTPRNFMIKCGPQVVACVQKWLRKRSGETRPMENTKRCDACGTVAKESEVLKMCGKCRTARYCNADCQRSNWPSHKKSCRPFTADNCVTVKPFYPKSGPIGLQPTADFVRTMLQVPQAPTPAAHHRMRHVPKDTLAGSAKNLVVKVQLPLSTFSLSSGVYHERGPMMVYTKKRDLVCHVRWGDNGAYYERLWEVVKDGGVNGAKAYFAAELKTKEELVIKLEPLAEQPF